jgi:carboxyl-terminal processing protease
MRGGWYIDSIIPGGPAEEAGLKAGDRIVTVDGAAVRDWTLQELSSRVRGESGTQVRFTAARFGESGTLSFTLTRRQIFPVEITYEDLGNGIALVTIPQFSGMYTYDEFYNVYTSLPDKGFERVIFDLRDNTGGSLMPYLHILNLVINQDELPLLHARDRDGAYFAYYSEAMPGGWTPKAMTVLVNGRSASAAELFAGSLRDYHRASIVGETTLGKGYMQYHLPGAGNDHIVISTDEVMLPVSGSYDGVGVAPCYPVAIGDRPFPLPSDLGTLSGEVNRSSPRARIQTLQRHLALLNYYNGGIDGLWNDTLIYALGAYQRANGLRESGACDSQTVNRLRADINALRNSRVPRDTQLEKAIEVVSR